MENPFEPSHPWDRLVLNDQVVPAICNVEPVRKDRIPVAPAQFDVRLTIYDENREAVLAFIRRLGPESIPAEHPELQLRRVRRVRVLLIGKGEAASDLLGRPITLLPLRMVEA